MWEQNIIQFLKKYNFNTQVILLYKQALTHPSYKQSNKKVDYDYQRLEFLGDSILSMMISLYIYKNFDNLDEGQMTMIKSSVVASQPLIEIVNKIKLKKLVRFGKSAINNLSNNIKVYSDIFESFIASLYLTEGFDKTYNFLYEVVFKNIKFNGINNSLKNPKTILQENLQSKSRADIEYKIIANEKSGFNASVYFAGLKLADGQGESKQKAEVDAATNAIKKLASKTNRTPNIIKNETKTNRNNQKPLRVNENKNNLQTKPTIKPNIKVKKQFRKKNLNKKSPKLNPPKKLRIVSHKKINLI
ncbi:MAG: ribonuclease III [Mycoplasma sp.]|nr:ribonuclease III [Mycoplasma sp.]